MLSCKKYLQFFTRLLTPEQTPLKTKDGMFTQWHVYSMAYKITKLKTSLLLHYKGNRFQMIHLCCTSVLLCVFLRAVLKVWMLLKRLKIKRCAATGIHIFNVWVLYWFALLIMCNALDSSYSYFTAYCRVAISVILGFAL